MTGEEYAERLLYGYRPCALCGVLTIVLRVCYWCHLDAAVPSPTPNGTDERGQA